MKALITGGAGFIGSHLAQALCRKGAQVVVLDNLSFGNLRNLDWKGNGDALEFSLREFFAEFLDQRVGSLACECGANTNADSVSGLGLEHQPRLGADGSDGACCARLGIIDAAGDFAADGD